MHNLSSGVVEGVTNRNLVNIDDDVYSKRVTVGYHSPSPSMSSSQLARYAVEVLNGEDSAQVEDAGCGAIPRSTCAGGSTQQLNGENMEESESAQCLLL